MGTEARYIEGAEMYTQNTENDITRMRTWMKEGMAAHSQFVIAANLSTVYSNCACDPAKLFHVQTDDLHTSMPLAADLTFGPGVYDFPTNFNGKGPGSAAMWQNDLTISLNGTDRGGVTWAYSERYDWFGRFGTKEGWKPNVPAQWVAATVAAREAVRSQPGWPPR